MVADVTQRESHEKEILREFQTQTVDGMTSALQDAQVKQQQEMDTIKEMILAGSAKAELSELQKLVEEASPTSTVGIAEIEELKSEIQKGAEMTANIADKIQEMALPQPSQQQQQQHMRVDEIQEVALPQPSHQQQQLQSIDDLLEEEDLSSEACTSDNPLDDIEQQLEQLASEIKSIAVEV